jgi:hypothetical protein
MRHADVRMGACNHWQPGPHQVPLLMKVSNNVPRIENKKFMNWEKKIVIRSVKTIAFLHVRA